jgi:alkylation response protein AidB-like acyl-CoA dehydrogenase
MFSGSSHSCVVVSSALEAMPSVNQPGGRARSTADAPAGHARARKYDPGMSSFPLFALSEEHQAIREAVRSVCDAKVAPYAADVDENARYPREAAEALQAADFHAPHVPEEYGGAGADALATVLVIEEVARACMASSLIPAVNKLGSLPVMLAGSEELKKHYLGRLAAGEGGFSYCLSEPDAGSDAAAMKCKAVRDGDDWVLNGVKRWITNAGESEFYTVMAVTDPEKRSRGISAFVVEKSDEGVSFGAPEKKLGIKGSPTREVYLDKVRVPADRMIGEEGTGFETAMRTLDHTRVTIAAQAVGVAQGALDHALGYAKERQQFGKPIADFQGLQFLLADMGMKVEAARQMTYAAAGRSERNDKDLTFFGAAAKCFASDVAMEVTTDAVQVLGGYGYTREYPVERMMRDAKITQIYEGTNQVQRIVIARQLLAGVQSEL